MTDKIMKWKSKWFYDYKWFFDKSSTSCVNCRKRTKNLDSRIFKTKNVGKIIWSNFAVYSSKKSRLVKEQEAKGLSCNLGLKTFHCLVIFCFKCIKWIKLSINLYQEINLCLKCI